MNDPDTRTDPDPAAAASRPLRLAHSPAEGTVCHDTGSGDGAGEVLKATGLVWRWSRPLGAWYVRQSRDRAPNLAGIEATAAAPRAAGFTVAVDIDTAPRDQGAAEADRAARARDRADALHTRAERHADRAEAAAQAADAISEHIPLGQPVLVGTHAQRRQERDLERIHRHTRTAAGEVRAAAESARRAEVPDGATGFRENPHVTARRLARLRAERRRIARSLDGHSRTHRNAAGAVVARDEQPPAGGALREQLLAEAEHLDAQISHWQQVLADAEADGRTPGIDFTQVAKGDLVKIRGQWREVVRVNKATVTVTTGYSWTARWPRHEVTDHQRHGEQPQPDPG